MRKARARAGAGGCAAVLVAACALGERIPSPQAPLPERFEAPQAGRPVAPDALDHWWRLFGDDQLTGLVEQALADSPDAKTALFRLQEARAQADEAIAGVLPKGDVSASAADLYSRQTYSHLSPLFPPQFAQFFTAANGSTQTYAANWNVSWEIDLYGKDLTAIRAASASAAAARFAYEAARFSLAAQVAADLFQGRGVAVQLENARETLKLSRNLAETSRRKAAAGLGTGADAARTASDAESAEAQVALLEAQLIGAERALLVLVGKGGAPTSELVIHPEVHPPPEVPAATPGSLLERRPDVREARANLVVAAGELRLDKLALFPSLTLEPALQASRQVYPIYTITTTASSGGVGLQVPVLGLPKLLAEVRAQGARGRQAVAAYEKTVQTAYGDAERALTSVGADARRVRLLEDAEKRSRYAYDAADTGYRMGLTDLTTVVQAEQLWRQTLAAKTLAEVDALVDTVSAFKALGGGWNYTGTTR